MWLLAGRVFLDESKSARDLMDEYPAIAELLEGVKKDQFRFRENQQYLVRARDAIHSRG